MGQQVLTEVRARLVAALSRPVLTESDKKTVSKMKDRMLAAWRSRILSDSNKSRVMAEFKSINRAMITVLNYVNGKGLQGTRDRTPVDLSKRITRGKAERILVELKKTLLSTYTRFALWLKTPVTVSSVLVLMGAWTFFIYSTRLGLPWSYLGDASGYGVIFMTAAVTARLTVNSPKLWLQHAPSREPAAELEQKLVETEPARRTLVLDQIEKFLGSDLLGPVEINLKANAFLMRKRDWQSLQDALYDTFLKGAPPLLFELGHRLGRSVGRDLMRISQEPNVVLSHLGEVSRALGWGIISVEGRFSHESKLTFQVQESPFSVAESPLEENTRSCHMLVGLVTGISEEVYDWPCSSSERRCVRDGSDCCEIEVTPATVPRKPKNRWNLSVHFPSLYPWERN